ncbi:type IV pilus assembly protein PilM [Malonomonas rubra DSM 5091]|uniref:Type IV pilus assembly protein PilM n=1 Tax=Malonomonas rubra DSM 5091 TaxID=1122189 RepID=A0A1M6BD84_MALRU|nr:pilus assembly protein PilM [Malonomonas rubra]SHI46528.1 type IV pilus assembly protein PilM [Malonomonas rubra DSM 5091]
MFRRNYLGLEISREGLRAIAVQRRGSRVALSGGKTLRFGDDLLHPSVMEPNVRQPDKFVEAVREVLMPLAKREKRIAVALPDASGHLYLLEIETPFKGYNEGLEIVRWQLKDMLPPQLTKYSIDYQLLGKHESGSQQVLASVVATDVLHQYEELLVVAGFAPGLIDFHALNMYNAYHGRIELGNDFFLVAVDSDQLCLLAFENRRLDLYRTKTVALDSERIFQEINRSMVGYRKAHGSLNRMKVHLHTDWTETDELSKAVEAAFEKNVDLLPSPLLQLVGSQKLHITDADARSMAAALGIAERMITRVNK